MHIKVTLGYAQSGTYRTYNGYVSYGKNYAPYVRCSRQARLYVLWYSGYCMARVNG